MRLFPPFYQVQEFELLDVSFVKDARCGKPARAPKVGNISSYVTNVAVII